MARTTLNIDSAVLEQLRQAGRREGKSIGRVASELLARALAENARPPATEPLRWNSGDLGEPRVDLEDAEALRAVLEGRP